LQPFPFIGKSSSGNQNMTLHGWSFYAKGSAFFNWGRQAQ
jgi:hypothetical protein